MSRSLAGAFTTEKNRIDAEPFNSVVFHFGGSIGDIYVAARDCTIGGNAHFGAVTEWGEWGAGATPRDGNFTTQTMTLAIINYPIFGTPKKRFTDLWAGLGVEAIEVDIYQNIRRKSDGAIQQELLYAGVMRPGKYSPDRASIELISVSDKYLARKEVSWVITQTDFPNVDLDDVGKRANLLYGAVKKVPCLAVVAAPSGLVRANMTTTDTTVPIYDEFYDLVTLPVKVQIGNERISAATKSGAQGSRVLGNITRQVDSTPLESHSKNDSIIQIITEFVYQASGRRMLSIDQVYVKRGDKVIPLATGQYTTELANTTLTAGRTQSLVKFTSPPLVGEKDFISISDAIGVNDAIGVSQAATELSWRQAGADFLYGPVAIPPLGEIVIPTNITSQEKTKSSGLFGKTAGCTIQSFSGLGAAWQAVLRQGNVPPTYYPLFTGNSSGAGSFSGSASLITTDFPNFYVVFRNLNSLSTLTVTLNITNQVYTYNVSNLVSKTGAATKTGTVTLSTTSTADLVIGDAVLVDGQGEYDDGSGTYTGSAGALITKPADVLHHLARAESGIPVGRIDTASFSTVRGEMPASYAFAGNIVQRSTNLLELLVGLGGQCRTVIDWPVDKLRARLLKPNYPSPSKTLTSNNVMRNSGKTSLQVQRGDEKEIFNIVNIYYGRDWTVSRGRTAYQRVQKVRNEGSITKYGERDTGDRFFCDFIDKDNLSMAADLAEFYKVWLGEPWRWIFFDAKLDQFELLPNDIVALNFAPGPATSAVFDSAVFDTDVFGADRFDGLSGAQKLLVQDIRLKAGSGRGTSPTRMPVILREVP